MKEIQLNTQFTKYTTINELSEQQQMLIEKAYEFASKAYVPYSNFRVGCAILLDNGEVVGGNNQENASYPAGICAERTALSVAASLYPTSKPVTMGIVVNDKNYHLDLPTAPCGICRQSINEVEAKFNAPIEIIFPGENGSFYGAKSIESLLPLSFKPTNLKK